MFSYKIKLEIRTKKTGDVIKEIFLRLKEGSRDAAEYIAVVYLSLSALLLAAFLWIFMSE